MDKNDRTDSSVRRVGSSDAGVGASAMVVSVGAGWERLADMGELLINLHVAKQASASHRWTRSSEKDRGGVFW